MLADPNAALAEFDITVPEGCTINVIEDEATVINLPIPCSPAESPLSDEDLDEIAGGYRAHAIWTEYTGATLSC